MRTFKLADLEIDFPAKPRPKWGDYDPDKEGSDCVVLRDAHTGADVVLNARDFGQHTLTHGITDLVSKLSYQK